MRANIFSWSLLLAFFVLILLGCGQKSPLKDIKNFLQETPKSNGQPKEPFDPYALDPDKSVSIEGFSLWVVDESNQPNAELSSIYRLSKKEMDDGEVLLSIAVHGSPGIPHSLLYLRYDSIALSPKAVEIGEFF